MVGIGLCGLLDSRRGLLLGAESNSPETVRLEAAVAIEARTAGRAALVAMEEASLVAKTRVADIVMDGWMDG